MHAKQVSRRRQGCCWMWRTRGKKGWSLCDFGVGVPNPALHAPIVQFGASTLNGLLHCTPLDLPTPYTVLSDFLVFSFLFGACSLHDHRPTGSLFSWPFTNNLLFLFLSSRPHDIHRRIELRLRISVESLHPPISFPSSGTNRTRLQRPPHYKAALMRNILSLSS